MSRLTKEIRTDIHDGLMARKFEGRDESIEKMIQDLGLKVYNTVYPRDVRKKMASFPEGAFVNGKNIKVAFGGERRCFKFEDYKLFFYEHANSWNEIEMFAGDHQLTAAHREIAKAEGQLKSEREALSLQVTAALRSCNTIKQLTDAWPEVVPFLPPSKASPAGLPALPFSSLNKMLALPVTA